MTRHDAIEADLFSVFDADAQAPIPAGGLERLHAAIANQQPRPARLAGLGGRWIGDPSAVHAPLGALRAGVPVLRLSAALLLVLLTVALIGTAALIGNRLLERPPGPEKLLYELGGDIYLADADGGNPVRIVDGAELLNGSPWAPDGRHFLSLDTARMTAVIRDTNGDEVSSLPTAAFPSSAWSPDSTRLQMWATRRGQQINIYGIDGALQAELPLPDGYARPLQFDGVWAPDGRSVWVQIAPVQESPCADDREGYPSECAALETWELPIDGSAPRRVVESLDIRVFDPTFSRDGTRMAFAGRDGDQPVLSVANADGTEARAVVRAGQDSDRGEGTVPIWSPNGEELAYITESGNLKIVDVATGTVRTLSTGWPYTNWPPHSWSRDGDRVMFSKGSGAALDGVGLGDLWTVDVDGGEPTLLVEGATRGAWQPQVPAAATPSQAPTPSDAGIRPGASLIRIAGHDVSVVLPDGLAGRLPPDGDVGNGFTWGNNDDEFGRTGRWRSWYLYAPGAIDGTGRIGILPLPSDPVAWLRQIPGLTVLAERDIEVGGQPARLLDVVRPEGGAAFLFEVPVGDSGASDAWIGAGGAHSRLVIWQLGHTWMVAQANASHISILQRTDAPDDLFMQFIADLRFP